MNKFLLISAVFFAFSTNAALAIETRSEQFVKEKQARAAYLRNNTFKRLDNLKNHNYNLQSGIGGNQLNNLEPTSGMPQANRITENAPPVQSVPQIIKPPVTQDKSTEPTKTPGSPPPEIDNKMLNIKSVL